MSDVLAAVFAIVMFRDSPDIMMSILSLNPLELAGLAALAGSGATGLYRLVAFIRNRFFR